MYVCMYSAMTVIAQDDHLTAGAWAACDLHSFLTYGTVIAEIFDITSNSLRRTLKIIYSGGLEPKGCIDHNCF